MGTRPSGGPARPGDRARSGSDRSKTELEPPIISRFTSHPSLLQVLLLLKKRERESIELLGFVPCPLLSNLHTQRLLPTKLPHLPLRRRVRRGLPAYPPRASPRCGHPAAGSPFARRFPLRPPPNFSGPPPLRRLLLCGFVFRGCRAARSLPEERFFREGLGAEFGVRGAFMG